MPTPTKLKPKTKKKIRIVFTTFSQAGGLYYYKTNGKCYSWNEKWELVDNWRQPREATISKSHAKKLFPEAFKVRLP